LLVTGTLAIGHAAMAGLGDGPRLLPAGEAA
jgi:hypothetical protein